MHLPWQLCVTNHRVFLVDPPAGYVLRLPVLVVLLMVMVEVRGPNLRRPVVVLVAWVGAVTVHNIVVPLSQVGRVLHLPGHLQVGTLFISLT